MNGLTLLGAIALFFEFSPKIVVEPGQPLASSDAFSAPFIIANDGYLSLEKVSARCMLGRPEFEGHMEFQHINISSGSDVAPDISPGEKLTVRCRLREAVRVGALLKADIGIIVTYKTLLWPFERARAFRFESAPVSDGSWRWLPQPLSK